MLFSINIQFNKDIFEFATQHIQGWLFQAGMSENSSKVIADYSGFAFIIAGAVILYYITKIISVRIIHRLAEKSKSTLDDALVDRHFFTRLSYLVPAIAIHLTAQFVIPDYPVTLAVVRTVIKIWIYTVILLSGTAALNAFHDIYSSMESHRRRPIKGFIQIIKIILYVIYLIILITILFVQKHDFGWLAGLGAFSAVLLLVFKDPILGFVGGLQLTMNDMLRIGDWIEMPKYGADGTVIDVTITTVKVQNWDKTITTIPTYSLVSDSYKNWRGMEESGGRRIKRSVLIDMNSVKFCTPDMLERFMRFEHVASYVRQTEADVAEYNKLHDIDNSELVNGRRQTNLGIFRAYLKGYLEDNNLINKEMTFMVRQLQPTENGIPMEIYVFSKVQDWIPYENIQADIFDHVLASIPHFDLHVFQNPSGSDFMRLADRN